jgi:uracil-DNA glycosylase
MHETWKEALSEELYKPYFQQLEQFIRDERRVYQVYPPHQHMLAAFETPLNCVRVVILGQDPYHGSGQAHGLAFSVRPGAPIPPSLVNIYQELKSDIGVTPPIHGCLTAWACRGVLLLNTTLTVRAGKPMSHVGKGWETFTDTVINILSARRQPVAFVLWGRHAQSKAGSINGRHILIMSSHPSPMSASRGFFGSRPFSRANRFLAECCIDQVDWSIPSDPHENVPMASPVLEPKIVTGPDFSSL